MLRRTLSALAIAICSSACGSLPTWYVEEPAPAPAPPPPEATVVYEPEAAVAYEPVYYGDNVVYYDDVGRPYYYDGVAVVWIQPAWPGYWGYVNHYHRFGPAYHAWYHSHPGYGGHHGGYHGGYHGSGGGHRR